MTSTPPHRFPPAQINVFGGGLGGGLGGGFGGGLGGCARPGPPRDKTARDLQREIRSRAKRRSDVHKPVLAIVRRRIESKAALNHLRMVYKIPDFLPGLPVYDVGDVARSIADALDNDGFLAEVYDPDTIYVSWDKSEVARAV